jgi:glycogen synthase
MPGVTALRIALVSRQYPPDSIGGIGTYTGTVAEALAAVGHEVVVVHTAAGQRRETTWDANGVRVERFPAIGFGSFWRLTGRLSTHLTERVRAALSAFRAVRRLQPFDVIEAPEWKAEGLLLRWARRGPVVVHLHLLNRQVLAANRVQPGFGRRLANTLEIQSARFAHGVTASSRISLRIPEGGDVFPAERARLVTPPLRPGPWSATASVATTDPVVLAIGRLEPLKCPEVLIEALARVPPMPGLRLIFVGRSYRATHGEPYEAYLRRLAIAASVDCEILPPIGDLEQLCNVLAQARVVAVPSRFETLSMVALEAMAAARPVVMGTRVGMAEWATDRTAAPTVDVDDPGGWATALTTFLTDVEAAARAGASNRARALELSAPASVVSSRVAAYEAVMVQNRRGQRPRRTGR